MLEIFSSLEIVHENVENIVPERSPYISQESVFLSLKYEVGRIIYGYLMSSMWDI